VAWPHQLHIPEGMLEHLVLHISWGIFVEVFVVVRQDIQLGMVPVEVDHTAVDTAAEASVGSQLDKRLPDMVVDTWLVLEPCLMDIPLGSWERHMAVDTIFL